MTTGRQLTQLELLTHSSLRLRVTQVKLAHEDLKVYVVTQAKLVQREIKVLRAFEVLRAARA